MQCVLATRPYEINPGSADALCDYWVKKLRERITKANIFQYSKYIKNIMKTLTIYQSINLSRNLVLRGR